MLHFPSSHYSDADSELSIDLLKRKRDSIVQSLTLPNRENPLNSKHRVRDTLSLSVRRFLSPTSDIDNNLFLVVVIIFFKKRENDKVKCILKGSGRILYRFQSLEMDDFLETIILYTLSSLSFCLSLFLCISALCFFFFSRICFFVLVLFSLPFRVVSLSLCVKINLKSIIPSRFFVFSLLSKGKRKVFLQILRTLSQILYATRDITLELLFPIDECSLALHPIDKMYAKGRRVIF